MGKAKNLSYPTHQPTSSDSLKKDVLKQRNLKLLPSEATWEAGKFRQGAGKITEILTWQAEKPTHQNCNVKMPNIVIVVLRCLWFRCFQE